MQQFFKENSLTMLIDIIHVGICSEECSNNNIYKLVFSIIIAIFARLYANTI